MKFINLLSPRQHGNPSSKAALLHKHASSTISSSSSASDNDDDDSSQSTQRMSFAGNENKRARVVSPAPTLEKACLQTKVKNNKHVSFSIVQQRAYPVIVGDTPCATTDRYPLMLDWHYHTLPAVALDTYEHNHREHVNYVHAQYMEPLSAAERFDILRCRGGLSARVIRQHERRRKIQAVLEWAYSNDQHGVPAPCQYANTFVQRYMV